MSSNRPMYAETAPSSMKQDEPIVSRWVGGFGWSAVLVGVTVAIANIYSDTARLVPESAGWLLVLVGLVGVFFHATVETDELLRRTTLAVGGVCLVAGIALMAFKYNSNWPVGLLPFVPGLILVILYARREPAGPARTAVVLGLGGFGAVM